jgi:hypothetical protein
MGAARAATGGTLIALLVAFVGCGRINFDELAGSGSGSADARFVDATFRGNKLTYVKASNTDPNDQFGSGVAVSADGNTFAVGAAYEDSGATGIDGAQDDGVAAIDSGAVYVFARSGDTWVQQAYVKASNTDPMDAFGIVLTISGDGNTLAVSAFREDSATAGINGDETSNTLMDSGAVYVYSRVGTTWSQQAYIKAFNPDADDQFGRNLSISDDGNTLAVAAYLESSNATGVDGDGTNNLLSKSGAVYVYSRTGTTWSHQSYLKASNPNLNDQFGWGIALAGDGNTLAVSAVLEDASAGGGQADNSAFDAGAAYVFKRVGGSWSQIAYLKAANAESGDYFGQSIAITAAGDYVAVGAHLEDSNAATINGNGADNSLSSAGAAYVFARSGDSFTQQAYIKPNAPDAGDVFGNFVSLSRDGYTLAVAANGEASSATGIGGDDTNDTMQGAGATYVFARNGTTWSPRAYVKATNTELQDDYGWSVAMSSDATVLLVGARSEDSAARGLGGDQTDNTAQSAGAAYLTESL